MKPVRTCSIFFRPDGTYIFGSRNTAYGLITNVPGTKLPAGVGAEVLGNTLVGLLRALSQEFVDVDLAAAGREYEEHLKSLGFKSNRAFARGARLIGVELKEKGVEVLPYEPVAGGGFVPVTSDAKICEFNPQTLGEAVLSTLESQP